MSGGGDVAAAEADQKVAVELFQRLRDEQQRISGEVTRVLSEKKEIGRVVDLLKELDGEQQCFRLIGDTLCEFKVSEVVPKLEQNLTNLGAVHDQLYATLVEKGRELNDVKTKYNIRFLNEKETMELRQQQMAQLMAQKKA